MVGGSFSDLLREEVSGIWASIFSHPFISEMGEGTLPLDKFRFYIRQDYAYLMDFSRCLGLAAAKADDVDSMRTYASLLNGCLSGEVERLEELSEALEMPVEILRETELAPSNFAYTRHLLNVAFSGTVGEILASMLPCMWTYQIIGERLVDSPALDDGSLYREWAEVYSSAEYAVLVDKYRELTDRHAEGAGPVEREKMRSHFVLSSRYEYLFWEMAYSGGDWEL
jgi:thiaminase/transcriptional activator TenA